MSTEQQSTPHKADYDPARKLNGANKIRKPEHTSLDNGSNDETDPLQHAKDTYEATLNHAQNFSQSVGQSVRQNPVLALGAAFGIGVAVAVLISRKT